MGTHYRGTREELLALDAFIKLVRAAESVSQRVEANFSALQLSASQFGVLEALLHLGPLFQKELARKLLKSGGNVTMVVNNLAKCGLVKRVRNEEDRRHIKVILTGKGRKLIGSFFPGHVAHIVRTMSVLTKAEQAELGRLCRKVGLGAAGAETGVTRKEGRRHVEKNSEYQ